MFLGPGSARKIWQFTLPWLPRRAIEHWAIEKFQLASPRLEWLCSYPFALTNQQSMFEERFLWPYLSESHCLSCLLLLIKILKRLNYWKRNANVESFYVLLFFRRRKIFKAKASAPRLSNVSVKKSQGTGSSCWQRTGSNEQTRWQTTQDYRWSTGKGFKLFSKRGEHCNPTR